MIQLQSILFPSKEVCEISELYYHRDGKRINFDGYFNLFYIEKRKKYTVIDSLSLKTALRGYQSLILVHDGVDIEEISLQAEERREYYISFPYRLFENGTFSFSLIEDELMGASERLVEGFYVTESELHQEVNIGIDICTYKREPYVDRNLRQLKMRILDQERLDVSSHVKIYVIDNGNTLWENESIQALVKASDGAVRIIANKNAGGAGGFTRGMLEVLYEKEQKALTHILLMDDDAIVEPDALVRIYGFLCTVRQEWKNITVGGAMLREEHPYMLYCSGEWWKDGHIFNPAEHLDLRQLDNAVCEKLTEAGHEYDRYSGWWCCCYSLEVVRDNNLPLPLFIHHDDIEFGLRNVGYGITFLNGVGVWHRSADMNFPGANLYYDVRNNLIEIALHQNARKKLCAAKVLLRALTSAVIRLKYQDVKLVHRGLLDFLAGPKWLGSQDPEQLNMEIRNMVCKFYPLENLRTELSAEEYRFIKKQILKRKEIFDKYGMDKSSHQKVKATKIHLLTYNGWLLPADKKGVKLIWPMDLPFETFRKKVIVLYDPGSGNVFLARREYKRLGWIVKYYISSLWALMWRFDKAREDYQKHIAEITSRDFWNKYLGLK